MFLIYVTIINAKKGRHKTPLYNNKKGTRFLEDCQIFQKRYYTDDNNDYLSNLFHLAIKGQHIDEIQDEKDNKNCYQKANEDRHRQSNPSRNGGL